MVTATIVEHASCSPRFGPRPLVAAGMAARRGRRCCCSTGVGVDSSYATARAARACWSWASASAWSWRPAMSTATLGVEPADAGVASAMVNTGQQIGGSIGTALLSTLAASAATTFAAGNGAAAGRDGRGRGARLHDRVLVVGGDLRRRRRGHRAAARAAARAGRPTRPPSRCSRTANARGHCRLPRPPDVVGGGGFRIPLGRELARD